MDNISGTLGISSQVLISMISVFMMICFMVLIYKFTHNILISLTTVCIVCIVLSMIGFVPVYIIPIFVFSVLLASGRKLSSHRDHKTIEKIDMGLPGISHDDFVEFKDGNFYKIAEPEPIKSEKDIIINKVDEKPVVKDKRAWGV
jgi:hypothetical protein